MLNYINSNWSMPRRLTLIAGLFLLPIVLQVYFSIAANRDWATLSWELGLLAVMTVLAALLASLVARDFTARLKTLLVAMDRISREDVEFEIPCISNTNENGQIAATLTRFKCGVVARKKLTEEAAEQARLKQAEGDYYVREHEIFMEAFGRAVKKLAEGDLHYRFTDKVINEYQPIVTEINLMAERLETAQANMIEADNRRTVVVSALGNALAKLAGGNLNARLDVAVASDFEKLKDDFNSAMEQLQDTIMHVRQSTEGIKLGTDEIARAADDLSRRTENQAASLEETAAAVAEITATVNKTAEGASHARDVVSGAKCDAQKSGEVVRKAIDAMNAIAKSSQQISQIIGVIDEIAFQTNLLALNAGVEAARAGDAGRGFAVVASEVRALAQRSAEAAKEIKGLISASTSQVAQGVHLVGETGQSLERIVTRVADIDGVVTVIASSALDQANGLKQVNIAVNEMDQVTQQNAAMVEEATAATRTLAQQTEELARIVSRFKTRDGDELAPRREQPQAVVRNFRAPARKVANGSSGKHASSGRYQQSAADAGWEEF